ncbi:hypothetical protein K466DRAFT_599851 [Polyporus arcularius HHB13444]|uniref:Uncharacterized protein n=1 Tax=Polyporus arcularius HHB13444 TaxID=1314778 RepID=A0A5C3PBA1_9APHY|nr:hypothetical protein K466DRAFT_599851 [Polyporus arcularius HHB13444]
MTEPALIPNPQLTRTGELYPRAKLAALDTLQRAALASVPRALSAFDRSHGSWAWNDDHTRAVRLSTGKFDEPDFHRLIGVLHRVNLRTSPSWVTVFPYYLQDAELVNAIFHGHHHPFDGGMHMYGEMPAVPVWLKSPGSPSPCDGLYCAEPQYPHEVRDHTDCNFARPGNLLHPAAVHMHDLVIMDVSVYLQADFPSGPPEYALETDKIALVHTASDYAAHISLDDFVGTLLVAMRRIATALGTGE